MFSLRSSAVLLLLFFVTLLSGILHGETDKDRQREQIDDLVRQLAHDKYAKREAARKQLVVIGEKALPAIREAKVTRGLDFETLAKQVTRSILIRSSKSKAIGLELAVVDEGKFDMGSPRGERNRHPDETLHSVRISRPFLVGKYEVTQDEYTRVMKHNPSWTSSTGEGKNKVAGVNTTQFPVENVTWYDAIEFCNRLSKLDGFAPYYLVAEAKIEKDSIKSASVMALGGNGYRLPTEAEWEFCCRAWTSGPYHFGNENSGTDANTRPGPAYGYGGGPNWTALGRTAKVGNYKPNHLGLFDMHGNVAEWCWDYFDKDYYSTSPEVDPIGPEKGYLRLLRGGSWMVSEGSCRSATRFHMAPETSKEYIGFRVARSP